MNIEVDLNNKLAQTTLRRGNTGIIVCPSPTNNSILFKTNGKNSMCITNNSKIQHNTWLDEGLLNIGALNKHIYLHYTAGIDDSIRSSSTFATIELDNTGSINISSTSNKLNIIGELTTTVPISERNGGTGHSTFKRGDLLVGGLGGLDKLSIDGSEVGSILVRNSNGIAWGYSNVTKNATSYGAVDMISPSSYTIGPFIGPIQSNDSGTVVTTNVNMDLLTGGLNRPTPNFNFPTVVLATGMLHPTINSTKVSGIGTKFTQELSVGCVINVISFNGQKQSRRVVSIENDTSIVIDSAFTLLNQWTNGSAAAISTSNVRFGLGCLNCNGTNGFTTVQLGAQNYMPNNWTIEFWIRTSSLSTTQRLLSSTSAAFGIQIDLTTAGRVTLSLGRVGSRFDIANSLIASGGSAIAINTYRHIALSYDGSIYRLWTEAGVPALSVTSSLPIVSTSFNSLRFGANTATFIGTIDDIRISDINRYPNSRILPIEAHTLDNNCLALNSFNNTLSSNESDLTSLLGSTTAMKTFLVDGDITANTVYYGYVIAEDSQNLGSSNSNATGIFTFSSNNIRPPLPLGYKGYSKIPCYAFSNATRTLNRYVVNSRRNEFIFTPPISTNITLANNVAPTYLSIDLTRYIPIGTIADNGLNSDAKHVTLLLTYNNVTNGSGSISIGYRSINVLNNIMTTSLTGTYFLQYSMGILKSSLDVALTKTGATYTIQIVGFSV